GNREVEPDGWIEDDEREPEFTYGEDQLDAALEVFSGLLAMGGCDRIGVGDFFRPWKPSGDGEWVEAEDREGWGLFYAPHRPFGGGRARTALDGFTAQARELMDAAGWLIYHAKLDLGARMYA